MTSGFFGRHYETGTIANALAAAGALNPKTGKPYSEALALGASGGIAFGYFVFEYTGHLPHVALLTRNTFAPFERALDNLAIKRDARETTDAARAEKNLRLELDAGNVVIVWADVFSLPYRGLNPDQMWAMLPLLVVGQEGTDFLVVDGPSSPFPISSEDLAHARGRVKKDRFRMMVLEAPDPDRIPAGLISGIETSVALFLDKPPAGSPNNFGITGMRHWAKMLTDLRNAKSWERSFQPGPRLVQALAGRHGQPGVWDWIETWGTTGGADRETYADFLEEAAVWTGVSGLNEAAKGFRTSATSWRALAEASMPSDVAEFKALKDLKLRHSILWRENGLASLDERAAIRAEMQSLTSAAEASVQLQTIARGLRGNMAEIVVRIADAEEQTLLALRALINQN